MNTGREVLKPVQSELSFAARLTAVCGGYCWLDAGAALRFSCFTLKSASFSLLSSDLVLCSQNVPPATARWFLLSIGLHDSEGVAGVTW